MKYSKPYLDYDRQVDLLVARGLVIADKAKATCALRRINYYRMSAYVIPFQRVKDLFNPGTTLEKILELYDFDHDLRVVIFNALEPIEVAVRSTITYYLAGKHGAFGYKDKNAFSPGFPHADWLENTRKEVERSRETFILHYKEKYAESPDLPIWMASEVISFGSFSKLFKGMFFQDQKSIADALTVHPRVVQSWLHCLVYIRNLCAHHSRIWNRDLSIQPQIPEKKTEWITPFPFSNRRIFAALTIMHFILQKYGIPHNLKTSLATLLDNYPTINRKAMGCPGNWTEHALWRDLG